MEKRYKDSLYFKERFYDTLNHVPVDESKIEGRVRIKSEEKLELLIGIYHCLKKDNILTNKCQLSFSGPMLKEIEDLKDEWVRFTKMIFNRKCRKNPDPKALVDFIDADMSRSIYSHWINVYNNGLQQYNIKPSIYTNSMIDTSKYAEKILYEIVCKLKYLKHFKIWRSTVKMSYIVLITQCLTYLIKWR